MSWLDRLTTASFRGFEFRTDSHDAKSGRRLVVHEFPGSDVPEVEDLGGKAWNWRLNAYFIGPDYDLERNGFLAKLATPGADWLNHPWFGLLWVRAKDWSIQESNDKGGYCTVSIEFVEGGGSVQPTTDRVDVAATRMTEFVSASLDDFGLETMSAGGMTAFVATVSSKLDVLRNALSLATLPLTMASQIRTLGAGLKGDLAALMAVPSQYATALAGFASVLGLGPNSDDIADTDRPRVIHCVASAAGSGNRVTVEGMAATDGAVRRNLVREDALRSRLFVASAAQIALADYRAAADRDAAMTTAVDALDTLLPSLTDAVFDAAVAARASLIEALLAQDLQPAMVRDVAGPLPAALLAHRLQVDESVFLARNTVRHPLFVSGRVYG
jgi:prophage DNA circulation protein